MAPLKGEWIFIYRKSGENSVVGTQHPGHHQEIINIINDLKQHKILLIFKQPQQ